MLTTKLDDRREGRGDVQFTPKTTGYYAVTLDESTDGRRAPATSSTAETTVWVDRAHDHGLGYTARAAST